MLIDSCVQPRWVVPMRSSRLPRLTCVSGRILGTLPLVVSSLVPFWAFEVSFEQLQWLGSLQMGMYTDVRAVRSFPALLGYGAALSTVMSAYEYTGGSLFGYSKDKNVDEYDRRTQLRKNFQSPGEQTLAELGEGRGT